MNTSFFTFSTLLLSLLLVACTPSQSADNTAPSLQDNPALPDSADRSTAGSEASDDLLAQLQGVWRSNADPLEQITIQNHNYTVHYDGEQLVSEVIETYAQCPDFCLGEGQSGVFPCFTVAGEFDISCYVVVSIAPDVMDISLLSGTGQTLRYRRD